MRTEESFIVQHAFTDWGGEVGYHTLTELPTEAEAIAYRDKLVELDYRLNYGLSVRRRTRVYSADPSDYVYHRAGTVALTMDAADLSDLAFEIYDEIESAFMLREGSEIGQLLSSGADVVAQIGYDDKGRVAAGVEAIAEMLVSDILRSMPLPQFHDVRMSLFLAFDQEEERVRRQILEGVERKLQLSL